MFDQLFDGIQKSFAEPGYIVVVIDTSALERTYRNMLQEGQWVSSGKGDWVLRIDPPNPQLKQQRHVHIAHRKHINTKNKQFVWNQDGICHDMASSSRNPQGMQTAKQIAQDVLHLGNEIILEDVSEDMKEQFLKESSSDLVNTTPVPPVWLVASVHQISDRSR